MNTIRAISFLVAIQAIMICNIPATAYVPVKRTELSNLCVNAIAQDNDGFIWIATANGLCKSYGEEYELYFGSRSDSTTIPTNLVTNLHGTVNGWMLVATNLGVCALEKGKKIFHRFSSDGPESALSYGFVEFKGKYFSYGVGGLYEVCFDNFQLIRRVTVNDEPVTSATVGSDGRLWVSNGSALYAIDSTIKEVTKVVIPNESRVNTVASGGEDILIGTHTGMFSMNPTTLRLSATSIGSDTEVRHILSLNGHDFIVSTGNRGVLSYSDMTDRVSETIYNIDFTELHTNEINCTFYDKDNNLWVGTFDNGEKMFPAGPRLFNSDSRIVSPFRHDFVTRMAIDKYGNIWTGTRNNGIGLLAFNENSLRYFNSRTKHIPGCYLHDFVQELTIDSSGRLWVGYNNNLFVCRVVYSATGYPSGLEIIKTFRLKAGVVSIAEDVKGRIWIGTGGNGLMLINSDLNLYSNHFKGLRSNNITRIIPYDSNHMLLSAYSDNIYLMDIHTHTARPLLKNGTAAASNAIDLMVDRERNLWIGTYHHGLFRIDSKSDTIKQCLDHNNYYDIVGILQDKYGNIWTSSSYGLYKFDNDGNLCNQYLKQNGLGGNQFHEKSIVIGKDGSLLFGGNNGIEQVVPYDKATTEVNPIKVVNSGLWKLPGNIPVINGDNGDTDISSIDHIELPHDNNSFSIEYFALNYGRRSEIEYSYMLKGRDKDFIYNEEHRRASYSDLSPGKYEFYVRSRYNGEEWQSPQHLITVTVKPNPFLSLPAIIIYAILILSILIFAIRLYIRFKLIRQKYILSEDRIRHEKQLTANRINFFTNISHELRTPLTLIYGPAKHLRQNYKIMSDTQIAQSFEYIDSNIERLLTLINQLLNFRRVNNETLPLQVEEGNIVEHLKYMLKLYAVYAVENNVSLKFEDAHSGWETVTYDKDKIEKIVSNLLINAIKYSGENGSVTLRIATTDTPYGIDNKEGFTYTIISVENTGNTVHDDDIPLIFQPFKRLLGLDNTNNTEGFGIGLHFVEQLVKECKGVIHAGKKHDGGMTFTVTIPVSDKAFNSIEFKKNKNDEVLATVASDTLLEGSHLYQLSENNDTKEDENTPRLLIVEDNESNKAFLESLFVNKYVVSTAPDGDSALDMISQECPDIIISDVLMPSLTDGFSLCRQVKSNPESSHVPVVLLTAKTLDQHKVEGYNCGADAYLCKPYNPDVLKACVDNLNAKRIGRAQLLMASAGLSNMDDADSFQSLELSPLEKKFVERLYAFIDENMNNCELNVNMLGRQLGFSRTNFYRKVKALMGVSPTDFLRHYRLNRAAELLLSREYTVGEVAEKTGFDSHSHFSSLFKKHFGVSPRTYVSDHFGQRKPNI